jgi:hypothetical protein
LACFYKDYGLIFTKSCLGYILGNFLTKSSGHLGTLFNKTNLFCRIGSCLRFRASFKAVALEKKFLNPIRLPNPELI